MTNINTHFADEHSLSGRIRLLAERLSQTAFTGISDPFSMELLTYALNVYADDAAKLERVLRTLRAPPAPICARPLLHDIIGAVAADFAIPRLSIVGEDRHQAVASARHVVWWLAKEIGGLSCRNIGIRMGGRDHSTVISGIRRINDRAAGDPLFRRRIDKLAERLVDDAKTRMTQEQAA